MTTILAATSRGQVTLPKAWRDQFDTSYFQAEVQDDQMILKPLKTSKTLKEELDEAWQDYRAGKAISQQELIKKYGL